MWLKILSVIVLIVVALFTYTYFKRKYIQARQKAVFKKIFSNRESQLPTLHFGSSYGWPTFEVTFQNKNDLDFAIKNKLTDDFKTCIKSYYSSKFDADAAIYFTHREV